MNAHQRRKHKRAMPKFGEMVRFKVPSWWPTPYIEGAFEDRNWTHCGLVHWRHPNGHMTFSMVTLRRLERLK